MPKHEHKSGAWFELPEDITQGQLESYESEARKIIADVEDPGDAVLYRAALTGSLAAKFVINSEGVPTAISDIPKANVRILLWMARIIGNFIADIKAIDPN